MTRIAFCGSRALHFPLGRIVVDRRAERKLSSEDLIPALSRHLCGDWGAVSNSQRKANLAALCNDRPLHSVYFAISGVRFHVKTNASRSLTSVTC
jgi:hypothetical protein